MSSFEYAHELKIVNKIQETPDACTFELKVPETKKSLFHYKPGQFLTVFMDINGNQVARSYSFSSSPIEDENLKITIKRVIGGVGSNYLLDQVQKGDFLSVSPPAGSFFNMNQSMEEGLQYYMFAAGSGITPLYSIIRWTLPHQPQQKINLFYSNKNTATTLFYNELKELEKKYPQLKVHFYFSQNKETSSNKLTLTEVKKIVSQANPKSGAQAFYLCGPLDYMKMIEDELHLLKIDKNWIHKESFFIPPQTKENVETAKQHGIFIGEIPAGYKIQPCETLEADIEGDVVTAKGNNNESVLETLLGEGHTPPFSCMSGSCQACKCQLLEGQVFQEMEGILDNEDLQNNYFLSCQAKPVSKKVKFKFIN